MSTGSDQWDPGQYQRFATERAQPFWDLLALVQPSPGGRAVDLGCGTGELTVELHRATGASRTIGVDSSSAMLERASSLTAPAVSFVTGDIANWEPKGPVNIVFANASLQWLPDHPSLLRRLADWLEPAGQLAVQVPANADHPSHVVLDEVAHEEPFFSAMDGAPPGDVVRGVLKPEDYATLLDQLGFSSQHVRLQVYGHRLAGPDDVVEWTRGTSMVRFKQVLDPGLFDQLLDRYRQRLLQTLGERSPYFYAFKRILLWGQR